MLKSFTIEDALKIQSTQLNQWIKILKPEYAERLQKWVESENAKLDTVKNDGLTVTRGTDLDMFIANRFLLNNSLYEGF